ncbi:hypothetical protein HP398_29630 [Brevibacillus sp. HB1.4B]|uniref:phage protein n=1 Tax=Brevibacillus sp. HB1.4B TaxID=2738845 RepID=UPI00156BD8E9|nr:hypothetical protein [Brevibacillus sp. HB1.4B]NRS20583.1 hypothetical protein [Brevibacillus sp. HB1.4B]
MNTMIIISKTLLLGAFFFSSSFGGGYVGDIRNIAIYEAQVQGVDLPIVLATLEAETNFTNKTGDNGNALGPGQVWPKWHTESFKAIASRMHLAWPSTLQQQTALVLSNDHFATAVAVKVIGRAWKASKQNFREFSLQYVGPKIPDRDYQRRLNIYLKYANGEAANAANTAYTPGMNTDANTTGQTGNVQAGLGPINDAFIPTTNYGVVANSQRNGNVLYGRRYRVLVANAKGTAIDVSDLRCTFEVYKTMFQPQFSNVTIYNLNVETENQLINEGDTIYIESGYEGEQYGLIFMGDVVQAIRGKEDGVTYKLTLNSLDSDRALNLGPFVAFSTAKGLTARDIIGNVASKARIPMQLGTISEGLSEAKLTRGKVFFGKSQDYLRQVAKSNAATFYTEDGKVNIIKATDYPKNEIVDLAPESGLIGTPMQSDYGVAFKCLLNPRLRLNSLVRINNQLIQAHTFQFGQIPRSLDTAGIYRIVELRHSGDTRGDNWYTECTTVSQAGGFIPGLLVSPNANPWGS